MLFDPEDGNSTTGSGETGWAAGEGSAEKIKGHSSLYSTNAQDDALEKDERGIPEAVGAKTHAYRHFVGEVGRTMLQSKSDFDECGAWRAKILRNFGTA